MTTDFTGIKPILDLPAWEHTGMIYNAASAALPAGAGAFLVDDKRASQYRNPNIWYLYNATTFSQYNVKTGGWLQLSSPALAGTFGTGAAGVLAPSQGPRGTIAAGATTTKITPSAVLPNSATVQANQLKDCRIRIIGNNAGGSGKTEERTIVGNTAGTTPTITLDSALSFTPGTGASYELLTGRVFLLNAGTTASNIFKYFDVGTTTFNTSAISTTNLSGIIGTDSVLLSLDELHTPITGVGGVAINGEVGGFFGQLTATASGATSLTGQAASGDASVLANEYRNFQIRIIEDTTTPTAVGQRKRIISHTAGASPVYTVSAWAVTPSANAKYYIENNNDLLLWTNGATTTYRFDPVALTWDSTTYAVRPSPASNGISAWQPFNRLIDADKNVRHSHIISPRGGNVASIDLFDIAAATTGSWTAAIAYDNQGLTLWSTGGCATYDPISNKTMIIATATTNVLPLVYAFDNDVISLRPYYHIPQIHSTAVNGEKLAIGMYVDGTDKKSFVYNVPCSQAMMFRSLIFI